MEATGSNQAVEAVEALDAKVEQVMSVVALAEVAIEVETKVDQVETAVEQVETKVEQVKQEVEQVKEKVEDIVKLVDQVYTNLKAQFDGQTSLPVCVLKVMSEVEKMIPKQQKKDVAVAVIQKLLPNVDASAIVELIDAFIVVAKAPGAVQTSAHKQPKGCCTIM